MNNNQINEIIRFFNYQAGTVYKFSAQKNQDAVYKAITASEGNIKDIHNYIKKEVAGGQRDLVKVMDSFLYEKELQKSKEAAKMLTQIMGEKVVYFSATGILKKGKDDIKEVITNEKN